MAKIKVKDISICYEIHGEGYPLVMIWGLGADFRRLPPSTINPFFKHFQTVLFDNRGAGRTDKPAMDYSTRMFADDTIGLMEALGIKKAHIMGASMGGVIAQEIVLNYPEKVDKLVLVITHSGGPHRVPQSPEYQQAMQKRAEMADKERMEQLMRLLYPEEYLNSNPDFVEQEMKRLMSVTPQPVDAYRRQMQAMSGFDAFDRLPNIKAPTLVLTGKKDVLVPWENSKILAEQIPGAKLVVFEESGHGLFIQEAERFAQTIIDFLTS